MAQVLTVPGDVRHGFSYNCSSHHDFGQTYWDSSYIVLLGKYLNKLEVDSEHNDVAITNKNMATSPKPTPKSAYKLTPDRMVCLASKAM
ncbi:Hypothetical predicted protein [Mytilus galloprovincialis]|uniref:Uncharacterized protein n=1 Tax=Mytilus galloprovincialis TaxID=29158 RepID=A0A8B6H8W0_MYTGA|nr:Hypothetical predicted protein [Mytilus galloprovincialis]